MIRKLFLQDWGIYESWESPTFSTITDIYAANGTGKSTLLDAISVGLGLGERHNLFEKRSPEQYQRSKGQPSFILMWLDNIALPSGKRRFESYGPSFSVLCRVDALASPQLQYLMFDGEMDLPAARSLALRRKWLRPAEYEEQWKRRGVSKEQRRQRIFKVGDTDRIRTNPEQLHALFREYTSNPEILERQDQTLQRINATKGELLRLDDALGQAQTAHRLAKARLDNQSDLRRSFADQREQGRLLAVSQYLDLAAQLDLEKQRASAKRRDAIDLRQKKTALEGQIAQARRAEHIHEAQLKTEIGKRDALADELVVSQKRRDAALVQAAEIERKERRVKELRKLPPTQALLGDQAELQRKRDEQTRAHGALEGRLSELRHKTAAMEQHRLPLNVVVCLDELRRETVPFTPAWEILPRDRPQGFEEALGRARFGLLIAPKDMEKTLNVMARHEYPGPASTLAREEFLAACDTTKRVSSRTFENDLGRYVVINDTPYLNEKLVDDHLKTLGREQTRLDVEAKALAAEIKEYIQRLSEVDAKLHDARERDTIHSEMAEWPRLKREHIETLASHEKFQEQVAKQEAWVHDLKTQARQAREDGNKAETELRGVLARLAEASAPSALESEVAAALVACQDFLEELRGAARTVKYHKDNLRRLAEELKGQTEASPEELADLITQVQKLDSTIVELSAKILTQKDELAKSELDHQRVVQEALAHEEKAFRQVKRNIEALGERFELPTRLVRRQRDDRWLLDYEVANRSNSDGLVFRPVKNSSDSTGEGVKACMIFLMGLSQPDDSLFYIFDEPAKNFSDDNIVDMFRIFQHTRSQVILTSAQRLDYGDTEATVTQVFLQAEPKGKPDRKALPARHSRYGGHLVTV